VKSPTVATILLAFISLAMFVQACKTRKAVLSHAEHAYNADSVFVLMKQHEIDFRTIEARLNMAVRTSEMNQSFNASLRLKKDSVLWLSIMPFAGIEAARVLITPDSLRILSRLENVCYLYDIAHLKSLLQADVDFDMLQALVTGNDLSRYDARNLIVVEEQLSFILEFGNRMKVTDFIEVNRFKHRLVVDKTHLKIMEQLFVQTRGNNKLQVKYDDFKNIEGRLFAHQLDFIALAESTETNALVKFSRISFDNDLTYPFTVPEKYTIKP